MRIKMITLILLIINGPLRSQPYKIDSSFGNNGISFLSISRELKAIAVKPNNHLSLCGYNLNAQSTYYQFALNSLSNSGQIDIGFGNQGNATTWIDSLTDAYDCAVQPDGKLVVAGTYRAGYIGFPTANAFIVRFLSNGNVDTSFGSNGKVLFNLGNGSIFAKLKVLPNGKILAAGNIQSGNNLLFLLVQYNNNGTYDLNFGTKGILMTAFPHEAGLWDMDVLHDGSIIASGNEGPWDTSPNPNFDIQMCMIKYTPNGTVDISFGLNGIVYHNFNPFTDDIILNVHEQNDGKLVATGVGNNQGVILRFLPNGNLDSTYDGDGVKTVGHVTRVSVLQSNDKLITTNNYLNAGGQDIKLVRYNTDASLDTTFGVNGNLNHNFSGINNQIKNVILDGDENIVVCGSSDSGSLVARYSLLTNTPNSTQALNEENTNLKVYPNPSTENLNLEFYSPEQGTSNIVILNTFSQVCLRENKKLSIGKNYFKLPIQFLKKGMYTLILSINKNTITSQFIKP